MTDEVHQAKLDYIARLRSMNPDEILSRRLDKMEQELAGTPIDTETAERRKRETRQAKRSAILAALGLGPRRHPQTPEQRLGKALDYAENQMKNRSQK